MRRPSARQRATTPPPPAAHRLSGGPPGGIARRALPGAAGNPARWPARRDRPPAWRTRSPADSFRVGVDVKPTHGHGPRCLPEERAQYPHRGSLSGAVGPQEAEEFPSGDIEVDTRDGTGPTRVDLHEVTDLDNGFIWHLQSPFQNWSEHKAEPETGGTERSRREQPGPRTQVWQQCTQNKVRGFPTWPPRSEAVTPLPVVAGRD